VRNLGLKSAVPVFALFFLSGLTGLVYQVIWLRQFTLIFGATAYASSAVL
jgi:spermidine synthase